MRYDAFISYSHARERAFSQVLQSALQRFAKPWYRRRALRIYRDETNLAVSPHLWKTLQDALQNSSYLILLASPASAQSEWVPREIEHWKSRHGPERILLVLVEGEIAWDAVAGDFAWSRTTALPRSLSGCFPDQPFHVDLRDQVARADLSNRNPEFQAAVAKLAAVIHGRELDEMLGEDLRQHRRTRRTAWSAVGVLTLLTLVAVTAALVARHQSRMSRSRELAALAIASLTEDPEESVRQALAGVEVESTSEAERALRVALPDLTLLGRFQLPGNVVTAAALSPSANRVVTGGIANALWAVGNRAPPVALEYPGEPVSAVGFSPTGDRIAFATVFHKVGLWETATGKLLHLTEECPESFVSVRFGRIGDDERLYAGGLDVEQHATAVRMWDSRTWKSSAVTGGLFEPSWLVQEGADGAQTLVRTDTGAEVGRIPSPGDSARGELLTVNPDGSLLAESHGFEVWVRHSASSRIVLRLIGHDAAVNTAIFDPPRRRLITTSDDHTSRIWDLRDDPPQARILRGSNGPVVDARVSPDGRWIATASRDRVARLWNAASGQLLAEYRGHTEDLKGLTFLPDGSSLLTFAEDGARLWKVTTEQSLVTVRAGPEIRQADFSPDRQWLLAASPLSRESYLCEFWTDDRVFRFADGVLSAVFSPSGRRFVAGTYDGRALVMEPGPPRKLVGDAMPHGAMVLTVAFDPRSDDRIFTGDADGRIRIFSLDGEGKWQGSVLYRHDRLATALAVRADGRHVASGGGDQQLRGWDFDAGAAIDPIPHPAPIMAVALSPDGQRVAAAAGPEVHLWTLANRQRRAVLSHASNVLACAFTSDGRWILTCAEKDQTLRLWDGHSGALKTSMQVQGAYARWAGLSRDGTSVTTAEQDDTIRVYPWDFLAPLEDLQTLAVQRLARIAPTGDETARPASTSASAER